jgi:hypothetical protein
MKPGLRKCKLGRKSIFTSGHKEHFENGAISEIRFPLKLMFYTNGCPHGQEINILHSFIKGLQTAAE